MLQNCSYKSVRMPRHDLHALTDSYFCFLLLFFSPALLNANTPLPGNCWGGRQWGDRLLG